MAINFPNNPNPNDTWSEVGKTWLWDGTTWKLNSTTASGIALTDLSVTTNAVGTAALSYNNAGVFSYTPPNLSGYSVTTHNHSFISITGTPSSYDAGKWLKVNAGGTALEWTDAPSGGGGSSTFIGLNDTPGTFTSQKFLKVNALGNALEWTDVEKIKVLDESTDTECYPLFTTEATGDLEPKTGSNIKFNSASGQLEAGSFKKTGGTAAEFLKADGSIDTTTYLSSVALNDLSNVDAVTNLANGKILKYDLGSTTWVVADDNASGGGSSSFTGLADTPSAHSNTKWLKSNGSALIWADAPVDTNTTYDLTASDGSVATEEKILLTGSDSSEDAVTLAVSGSLTIARSNNTITFGGGGGGATTLGGLSDVDTSGAASGNILTHNGTDWEVGSEIQSDWNETNANLTAYIKNKPTGILTSVPTLDAVLGAGNTSTKAATVGDFQCANLTVTGTTTTVNSNTVNIGDSNLTLNSDETGTPSQNGGLTIERGTSANVELLWNETSDKWQYTNDGSTYSDIGSGDTYSIQALASPGIQLLDNGNAGASNRVFFDGLGAVSINRKTSTTDTIEFGVSTFTGSSVGLVPNGSSAGSDKFLKSDGSWDTVSASTPTLDAVLGVGNISTKSATVGTFNATGTVTAAFLNVKDPKIVLNSDFVGSSPTEDAFLRVERGNDNDVNIKWNESSNKWQATDDGSSYYDLNQTNTNNYASSFSWNSNNGVLTLNRTGGTSSLSAITVDLDGRYATGTIPTNNNQLTNGAGYITSSGTITNAEKSRIRTDTGNTMHNLVFVDSYSDNQFQVLKVDNATNSLCYNPWSNRLIGQDFQSFRMTSWSNDYGDSGQFLMSNGSGEWGWSSKIHQESNGEIRISGPAGASTNLEGGHLQFEDSSGNTSYAIDVYRNSVGADIVMRFIDQSQSKERFSIGPEGQWGIGHVGGRSFGSLGQVMISRGPNLSPQWGNASGIAASVVGPDIDNIYAQLNAIGNDSSIITVQQIKNALAALVRS